MKQQIVQTGVCRRMRLIHWRALGRGLLFALLLTQQVWANLYSCCEPLPETPSAVAQNAHPACHAEAATAIANVAEAKPQSVPLQVVMCCPMPQSATEGVTLITSNQTALPTALPPVAYHALATTAIIPGGKSPPPLQRPLYLALSCWLI